MEFNLLHKIGKLCIIIMKYKGVKLMKNVVRIENGRSGGGDSSK